MSVNDLIRNLFYYAGFACRNSRHLAATACRSFVAAPEMGIGMCPKRLPSDGHELATNLHPCQLRIAMATATIDRLQDKATAIADRVVEKSRQAEDFAKEARELKARATEVFEDGMHAARRTLKRRAHDFEDVRDETARRVKRAPFTALGAAFAAGLMLGVIVGWVGHQPPKA